MFTGPVGPIAVLFYWPEDVFGIFLPAWGQQLRPKKQLFISCNGPKKNRGGRSVKKIILHYLFGQKCAFYASFSLIRSWDGEKNSRVGIFKNKNLLG